MTSFLSRAALVFAIALLPAVVRAQSVLPAPVALANPGGSVEVVVAQPDGRILVGGTFAKMGGAVHHNLARLNADGSVDPSFHPDVDFYVYAIAVSPTAIYIGGMFKHVGGVERAGLAALDPATGNLLPWNPAGGSPATVYAIAISGSSVYVGGYFSEMGGIARNALAAVDASTGAALPFNASISSGGVSSIAITNGVVYAGGAFLSVGGQTRNGLAAFDATTGTLEPFAPLGPFAWAFDVVISGSTLYVAGTGLTSSNYALAAIDLASETVQSWNPVVNGGVKRMALDGDYVYIAGLFSVAGGATRHAFAKISLVDATTASWDSEADSDVGRSVAVAGNRVYVGGAFTHAHGVETGGFARVDRDTAALVDSPYTEGEAAVTAVAYQDDGKAVIGGSFAYVDGTARRNLARLLPDGSVDPTFAIVADGMVTSLLLRNSTIYAGGYFRNVGGLGRNGLAAIDTATGVTTSWNPSGTSSLYIDTLAASDTTLYAGGSFSSVGGTPRANLAAIDLASGTVLPSWSADADGRVNALAVAADSLFVGGEFATIGGQPRSHLAALNKVSASALPWNPGADAAVRELATHAGSVYAGGTFSEAGGQPRQALAEIDADTGVVSTWSPTSDATSVHAFAVRGDDLYVGGDFTSMEGEPRSGLARFDLASHALAPWQVAVDGLVLAIGAGPASLLLGGTFSHVGGQERYGIAGVTPEVDELFRDSFDTSP